MTCCLLKVSQVGAVAQEPTYPKVWERVHLRGRMHQRNCGCHVMDQPPSPRWKRLTLHVLVRILSVTTLPSAEARSKTSLSRCGAAPFCAICERAQSANSTMVRRLGAASCAKPSALIFAALAAWFAIRRK